MMLRSTAQPVALVLAMVLAAVACSSTDSSATDGPQLRETQSTQSAPSAGELEATLKAIAADTGVPAIGAAAFDRDGVVDIAVAGVRQRGDETPVTVDDRFHLGSNTKAMTAALLARLAEHDRGVDFDTTVAEAFPDEPDMHDDYTDVTLAQLLAHVGGAPRDTPHIDESVLELSPMEGRAIGAGNAISEPAEVTPNTVSRYSNVGYVIVGSAMEVATGQSWEDLLQVELFTPLGMSSCGFGPPGTEGALDEPRGHDASGQAIFWDNPPLLGPAGTVHCSMADWGLFLTELLKGRSGDSDFLTQSSVERLLAPVSMRVEDTPDVQVALGWLLRDGINGPAYFHDGSNTAWYSQVVFVPDIDRIVLAVSNEEHTGQQAVGLALAALAEMYPA